MAGPGAFWAGRMSCLTWRGALGGDARLVLVTGDAGVGKTAAGRDVAITASGGGIAAGVIHGDVVPPNSDR
jgi:hypothetical protein